MTTQNNEKKVDYSNQNIYVGLDTHKKDWKVTINLEDRRLVTYSMEPNPQQLIIHLKKNYPNGNYYSAYEASYCGFWIHRDLINGGIKNIVVNAADIPTTHKEKDQKDDRRDSKKLARELYNKSLVGIRIPAEEEEAIRSLRRLRSQLRKDRTKKKTQIKSLLNYNGIIFPESINEKYWGKKFINYLRTIKFKYPATKIVLNMFIDNLLYLETQIAKVVEELEKYSKEDKKAQKIVPLLMTIPGIGFITAMSFYTEIMDINRFKTLDELCSFVGLVPSTRSSGSREVVSGITNRQNVYLRNPIIEAAWIASRIDPALALKYAQLKVRMKSQVAIIRIAKKLLNRIMTVWKNEIPYSLSVVE